MSFESTWWSSPIRRVMAGVGGPTIDMLNLGDYREFQLEFSGLMVGVAGDLVLQFSADNGVTWDTTGANYVDFTDAVLATAGIPLNAWSVSQQISGFVEITNFNVALPTGVIQRLGRIASNTGTRTGPAYNNQNTAYNAIRILSTQNFTRQLGVLLRTRKF